MSCNCSSTKSFKGKDGASAYQVWLSQGNSGSIADFLASLIGADGVNGIYLLTPNSYNTPVSNSSGVAQDLMTYTLVNANASPTPFEDGDILEIEARILTDGLSSTKLITTSFDATAMASLNMASSAQTSAIIKHTITRVDATHINKESTVTFYNGFLGFNTQANVYVLNSAVSNLDSTDVDIVVNADGVTGGDITCQYLRVKLIKQP